MLFCFSVRFIFLRREIDSWRFCQLGNNHFFGSGNNKASVSGHLRQFTEVNFRGPFLTAEIISQQDISYQGTAPEFVTFKVHADYYEDGKKTDEQDIYTSVCKLDGGWFDPLLFVLLGDML